MTLFLDDGDIRLYQGDCLDVLRELPAGSVDMVATSPPFYGLRDYGTGEWEGGDEGCDHKAPTQPDRKFKNSRGEGSADDRYAGSNLLSWTTRDGTTFKDECGKCGARRVDRQIGLEETPDQWVDNLVAVFRECRRVLADHGTLWVEIGDSYATTMFSYNYRDEGSYQRKSPVEHPVWEGTALESFKSRSGKAKGVQQMPDMKPKDLLGQPWLLAFALRADGWYLRSEIIWARPNPMPESVTDRPTKAHSTIFLLSKGPRYYYDQDAIREPYKYDGRKVLEINGTSDAAHENYANREGKTRWPGGVDGGANARSVWTIPTQPTPFAHFATWPQKLVGRMIQAGTSEHGKCPECGKPWARDVERTGAEKNADYGTEAYAALTGRVRTNSTLNGKPPTTTTRGWSPSCHHDTTPVPCTVLDPFAGSGTTMLVARNHGRHAIGIELNPDYCQIAAQRLQQLSLLT